MPTVTPIMPEGTTVLQAKTQPASALLRTPQQAPAEPKSATEETKQEMPGSEKEEHDKKLLRARLIQEKIKQQLARERKQIEEEKRSLEIERANSRKWQEANDLAAQGRYTEAAEKAGITYDQLTQQILNGGQIPPKQIAEQTANETVRKEIEKLKAELAEGQKKGTETQMQEARRIMASEAKHLIDNSDKYPLAKQGEAYEDIVKTIESEFHRTGRILPVEEAVKRWEEDALQGFEELLKLDSVRQRVLKESPKPETQPIGQSQREETPKTLTQRTMAPVPKPHNLTAEERRQRAIDAFYGRLT